MAVNRRYCKTDGVGLEFAPTYLVADGSLTVNPDAETYARAGWLENAVQPPSPPTGKVAASTRYESVDGRVVAVYEYADAQNVSRVFSKLKCYSALKKLGYWDRVKAWLDSEDLWDAFVLAQVVSEDHPQFVAGLEAVKAALCLTDEQAEAILSECVEA